MKKTMLIAVAGVAVVAVGCNQTADVKEGTTQQSDVTLEEVFNNAVERQADIKSVKASMTMTQAIEMNNGTETLKTDTKSDMTMDVIIEPMQLFVDGTIAITDPTNNQDMNMPLKMYLTEKDGFYLFEQTSNAWFKLPKEGYESILEQSGMSTSTAQQQLNLLKDYVSDFTFEQTDSDYVLTLNADDDKFNQLIKDQMAQTLPQESEELTKELDNITIDNTVYQLTIDKQTFDTKIVDMDMVLTVDAEGQSVKIDQKSTVTYDEVNTLSEITVPQEVLDSAQELPQQ